MSDETLTDQEVAAPLKVADKTGYTMAQRGEIPAFKVGYDLHIDNWRTT